MNKPLENSCLRNQFEELLLEAQRQCMDLFACELLLALQDSNFDLTDFLSGLVDALRSQGANQELIRHLEAASQYSDLSTDQLRNSRPDQNAKT
jgi:hypothetical protein